VTYPFLEIVENKQHLCAKVLTLKVHVLVIDAFPLIRKLVDTFHNLRDLSLIKMLLFPSLLYVIRILAVGVFLLLHLVRFKILLPIPRRL
ncbi:hypothetical protein H5410_002956, partial [Solanum commersonii]